MLPGSVGFLPSFLLLLGSPQKNFRTRTRTTLSEFNQNAISTPSFCGSQGKKGEGKKRRGEPWPRAGWREQARETFRVSGRSRLRPRESREGLARARSASREETRGEHSLFARDGATPSFCRRPLPRRPRLPPRRSLAPLLGSSSSATAPSRSRCVRGNKTRGPSVVSLASLFLPAGEPCPEEGSPKGAYSEASRGRGREAAPGPLFCFEHFC